MGSTATASVGSTGAAVVAAATAAAGLVAVEGNRTVSMTWAMPLLAAMSALVTLASFTVMAPASDTANSTGAPLRVSMRTGSGKDVAQVVPLLVGRTGTVSVFAAFVEADIIFSALAS